MSPFLQFALSLAIILLAAKAAGYVSYRLGQPSVLGELLVGIFLGPSVINLLHLPFFSHEGLSETLQVLAELGVMLLMFIAGLDLHLSDLAKTGKVAALSGILGVIFPLGLGILVGLSAQMSPEASIFLGLILAATSVSISAQTLMELKVLRSRVGIGLLGAAVFDDILVVLGLSVFIALADPNQSASFGNILWIIVRMSLYVAVATGLGVWLLPRLSRRIGALPVSQGLVAFSVVTMLLYGWAAEVVGNMAAITGAFLAGLLLARSPLRERIESGISSLAYGFFVPIFFISVGLSANARELGGDSFWLFLGMASVAIVGKVFGAGLGALISGFNRTEALQLGVGMMSRGEVGLIVASVGITQGLIGQEAFAAIVGVVIVTTLLTPPSLRLLFSPKKPAAQVETLARGGKA